ncbi:MAG: anhydro-N-acetylmuramic acid kinase [Ginsengibacter sp.]
MIYKSIGLMSGSSLDGLDICFAEFQEISGKWTFEILCTDCISYSVDLYRKLLLARTLSAKDYLLLDTQYGKYLGMAVNNFIDAYKLHHQVALVSSHGHTTFHYPESAMTHQLGNGAAIAAETGLPVVSDLRSLDIAFGGQGAPIVPLGETLLFPSTNFFLNLGGIANISVHNPKEVLAFDVCPANRILNLLAIQINKEYDENGITASSGKIHEPLLQKLNNQEYYKKVAPKSLSNEFGTEYIYPIITSFNLPVADALGTYVEHIALQIKKSLEPYVAKENSKLMITGGGAFNKFLVDRISFHLNELSIETYVPEKELVNYKEALIMALLGILRWREQPTVLASVTGAQKNSIGGALWLGTDA